MITRTFTSGNSRRRMSTAASVSSVGVSPQQASTTSGSLPRSLLAHSQMLIARRAVLDGLVHRQPLRRRLLSRHDDVDVIAASQTMVGDRQQTIRVGRQIDANDLRLLVDDMIDEAGVLMTEAVVILTPNVRRQQVVERCDRASPGNVVAHLQPFGVLIEHRIDDVNERFVAVEEAVAAGQQIAFQPALTLVLREHFHHATVGRDMIVGRQGVADEAAIRHFKHIAPAVRGVFVGAENAEVA